LNFLVYPYLEVKGKEVKAPTTFTFQRKSWLKKEASSYEKASF
jgi:hypothetical protein